MQERIDKAYEKLRNMALFSEQFEAFEALFKERLKEGREEEALQILLMVVYKLLKSDGERFNVLLEAVDDAKAKELRNWLIQTQERVKG